MSSYHNQAIAYRPEIDGLRAIAVLPVILFHAGFELFSGGYVGVDVFFVISGYLITSIILREIEQGKFSIVRFYERRARRILPALFFVIACCLPFAWMWMLPDELKRFGQSLVAVATFSSNIYFWRTTDYFAPAAEEQPLLHTWSLAVEEQYYVLFPLFLMLCWRFGKSKVFWLTVTSAALSLLLAEWAWRNQPVANFYLLPTRAWELLAGSLIAFIPRDLAEKAKTHKASQVYSAAGLLMIVYSILFFDSDTPFPSAYAIVPVLGSVILIVYTNGTGVVGSFLASKPLVGIGLISYSAYLWHQPIFAFIRLRSFDHPTQLEFALGAIASLAFAYFTWRVIETPFRKNPEGRPSRVLPVSALLLTTTFIFGFSVHRYIGLQEAKSNQLITEYFETLKREKHNEISSLLASKRALLLGDSHAGHLLFGLNGVFKETLNLSSAGCIPFLNIDRFDDRFVPGDCAKKMTDGLNKWAKEEDFDYLLLSSMGPTYIIGDSFRDTDLARVKGLGVIDMENPDEKNREKVYFDGLVRTLEFLSGNSGDRRIVFFIDNPELGISRRRCISLGAEHCKIPKQEYDQRTKEWKTRVKDLIKNYPSIIVVDPTDKFCDDIYCYGFVNGTSAYRDADHLNAYGSILVMASLFKHLENSRIRP